MFDVVIIGGGTAGVAAAYTTGKSGLNTLLIEKKDYLGGEMTGGLVVPMMNAGNSAINRDFFENLVAEMSKIGAQIEFQGNKGWFNPHLLKSVLLSMLEKEGVKVVFNVVPIAVEFNHAGSVSKIIVKILSEYNEQIHSDNISTNNAQILSEYIETRYIIDATGNCDFGKICGCEFLENKSDENQLVSLRFCMGGVNVNELGEFLKNIDANREVTPVEVIGGKTHLSTAFTWDKRTDWALYPLFQKAIENGDLTVDDANYFQIFSVAGTDDEIAFNCPRYPYPVDIFNPEVRKVTHEWLNGSIIRISNFCKKYLKGFENAYISAIADDIGVRVSRRIKGKYIYTEDDLKSGKRFAHPVLRANYPIDVHKNDGSGVERVDNTYELPIESLMSADIDNLFVAGRCLSADFKAQSALRVQQSCFSMGEGVVKYITKLIKNQ